MSYVDLSRPRYMYSIVQKGHQHLNVTQLKRSTRFWCSTLSTFESLSKNMWSDVLQVIVGKKKTYWICPPSSSSFSMSSPKASIDDVVCCSSSPAVSPGNNPCNVTGRSGWCSAGCCVVRERLRWNSSLVLSPIIMAKMKRTRVLKHWNGKCPINADSLPASFWILL